MGRPQLRVLSLSDGVRQCCAPDPAEIAADDAEWTRGRREAAEGGEATRERKGSGRQGANRGIREGGTHGGKRKRPGTTEHPEYTTEIGYRREREEGGRQCDRGHSGWVGG